VGASTYLIGAYHVALDTDADSSESTFSFFSDRLPLFFLPLEDALSAELRDLLFPRLAVIALCDFDSQVESGISDAGDWPSSLAGVDVDEPLNSTDDGLATPFTWVAACATGDFILDVD
jgi:hypothetical protein